MRKVLIGSVVGMSLLLSVAGGAAAPNANASEAGHCSSFSGQLHLRDDVAHNVASRRSPPGEVSSESAKNQGGEHCISSTTQHSECVRESI